MFVLSNIKQPTLILDENKAKNNISKIHDKLIGKNILFRPHFKTHQSAEIGNWFRSINTSAITVSSVAMAEYFCLNGWNDILIAFPVNLREIDNIVELAAKIKLSLLVKSKYSAEILALNLRNNVDCWIKIDVGSHRTGIDWTEKKEVLELADYINSFEFMQFKGILSHAGHTYKAGSVEEIREIYLDALEKLTNIKNYLIDNGIDNCAISVGDTPSASILDEFGKIDEIRPGNFLFYDMQQYQIKVCNLNEIAVCLACPVVAVHPERNEVVVYGGAIHLSKDFYLNKDKNPSYGAVVKLNEHGWDDSQILGTVKGLSQEHGILIFPDGIPEFIKPGEIVGILPAHSCLTVQANGYYMNLSGEIVQTMLS